MRVPTPEGSRLRSWSLAPATVTVTAARTRSRGAASVEVCALLRKPEAAKIAVDVKYVGFEIPDDFVVGYGLDFAERYRNLRDVAILAPHVYS